LCRRHEQVIDFGAGEVQHGGERVQRRAGALPIRSIFPSQPGDVVLAQSGDVGFDRGQVAASREYGKGLEARHRAGDGWRIWLRRISFGKPFKIFS